MSALACMLYDLGHEVIGSDVFKNFGFEEGLLKRNIKILDFNISNIKPDYVYIIGNAYKEDFVEVKEIKKHDYEYYYYHDFISKLDGFHIAISGTHGKSTTTKMIVDMLSEEPISYIIGTGEGKGKKDYKYFIYEACEYQDHFLAYHPDILVINNIELDHPDYFNSISDVYNSFINLSKQSKKVVINIDEKITKDEHFICYGNDKSEYVYRIVEESQNGYIVEINGKKFMLPFFGKHMINNFLSAYVVLKTIGYTDEFIEERIGFIKLPKRRMEEEKIGKQIVIQDYAHHPTEIKSLYDSISQKYPNIPITVFFQPHTYSRTLALSSLFSTSLSFFDEVYILPTFTSSREKYDTSLQKQVDYIFKEFNCVKTIDEVLFKNDRRIYVFLGAGEVFRYIKNLKEYMDENN